MMLEASFTRAVLPVGKRNTPKVPSTLPRNLIQYEAGEPGIKAGQ